jgi:hypothetical protein
MKQIAIVNTQAAGDCLLGTHAVRLYKQYFPDTSISFFVKMGLTATTAEGEMLNNELLSLLAIQHGVDNVGVLNREGNLVSHKQLEKPQFDQVIIQTGWFSDLGIVKSQSFPFIKEFPELDFSNTETQFNVGAEKREREPGVITIATSGPLDWNRKTKNDALRVSILLKLRDYIKQNNINARFYITGRDVEDCNFIESMQRLNSCDIYIGPMGLPVHMAAGLGVDTIHITSVFPPKYDSPQYYHSGWHHAIKSKNHCTTYSCVLPKLSSEQVSPEGPRTKYGFWPKYCEILENGKSCVYNTDSEDVIEAFDAWYRERGVNL